MQLTLPPLGPGSLPAGFDEEASGQEPGLAVQDCLAKTELQVGTRPSQDVAFGG